MTAEQTHLCDRLKLLGFTQGEQVRLYGLQFELRGTTGCSCGMGSPPTFDVAAFCASPVTCAIWDLLAASREQEQSQQQ